MQAYDERERRRGRVSKKRGGKKSTYLEKKVRTRKDRGESN